MRAHNREVYERNYAPEILSLERAANPYEREMIAIRARYLHALAGGTRVVDLGCGPGAYLIPHTSGATLAAGVDFSEPLARECARRAQAAGVSARVVIGDLQHLPIADRTFDAAYSIATLYYVPDLGQALRELARVLRPGGRALVEIGSLWSLNTLVARSAATGVISYHVSPPAMSRALAGAGLEIEEHRCFQLLPMYGGPWWLRPLVTSKWKRVMGIRLGGRMLDEIVSSLPILRWFAFRHVFICRTRQP